MEKDNFSALDTEALQKEIATFKKELFELRLNSSTMHIKDYSQFKKLRIRIARALSMLNRRKHESAATVERENEE